MIVVSNRIGVNPAHHEAFEKTFGARAGLVDGMPGFVSFQLLRPTVEGDPYIVMTFWEDEAAFKAWTESESFQRGHAVSGTLPRETFTGHPKLEVHQVIQSTTRIERADS